MMRKVVSRVLWRSQISRWTVPITLRQNSTFSKLLHAQHTDIAKEERDILQDLHKAVLKMNLATTKELDIISDTISSIDDIFLVVIVGEFNSGKSTLINSLLGSDYLKSGILPTTAKVCVLRHQGSSPDRSKWQSSSTDQLLLQDFEEVSLPLPWLEHIALVDTPGTNAIVAQHQAITEQVIPRSDLVLFVTSAERPITESEASFLKRIGQWGKKVILVVNKVDLLESREEQEQVLTFVAQNAAHILGRTEPLPIFGVSGKVALAHKMKHEGTSNTLTDSIEADDAGEGVGNWEKGNLISLERYLLKVLGKEEIIRNKLLNPLNVADRVIRACEETLHDRKSMLDGDNRVLEFIDENMEVFMDDMDRDTKFFQQQLGVVFSNYITRSDKFLDDNVTIFKPAFLLDEKALQAAFSKEVLLDLTHPIEDVLKEVSAVVEKRARTQAEAVAAYIGTRPSQYSNEMLGGDPIYKQNIDNLNTSTDSTVGFQATRLILQERLQRDARGVLNTHNEADEAKKLTDAVKAALYQVAAVQTLSAATVGALFTAQMLDLTGIIVTSSVAATSLMYLPYKKAQMKTEISDKIRLLQSRIDESITLNINTQLHSVKEKINHSLGPYSRFVRLESKKTEELTILMKSMKSTIQDIRSKIQ
mmetsp:Transcript_6393/g.10471  ORF Transcript_6393/g.10471 Transcript_6393/m.10471 type:complete len:648 (-) Transcript_6393:175-2118(-)